MVSVDICQGQSQAVDCDCLPWGSVGELGWDWEQQVSSWDTGKLRWTLPDVDSRAPKKRFLFFCKNKCNALQYLLLFFLDKSWLIYLHSDRVQEPLDSHIQLLQYSSRGGKALA